MNTERRIEEPGSIPPSESTEAEILSDAVSDEQDMGLSPDQELGNAEGLILKAWKRVAEKHRES